MKTTTTFNDKRRHELVNLHYDGQNYDTRHYEGLTFGNLQLLLEENYADPNETQNDSPSIFEILDFLKDNPDFTAHGYIVSPTRSNVRVSIKGVACDHDVSHESRDAFIMMFKNADEFDLDPLRAWYD